MEDPLDADTLTGMPEPVSPARLLAETGLTLAEIAERLGMSQADALAELHADGRGFVTEAHVSRIEAAAVDRAVSGEPSTVKLMLQAHKPGRYAGAVQVPLLSAADHDRYLQQHAVRLVALLRQQRDAVTVDGEASEASSGEGLGAPAGAGGENSSG